jgi:hypothetical protein
MLMLSSINPVFMVALMILLAIVVGRALTMLLDVFRRPEERSVVMPSDRRRFVRLSSYRLIHR